MKIEFTGRQMEIPREVRRLAERKLEKVARVLPRMTRAHVILTADKHRQVAEVSAHSPHLDLSAVDSSTNPRLSVSKAMDKLLRQAQRQRAKQRNHRGSNAATSGAPTRARSTTHGSKKAGRRKVDGAKRPGGGRAAAGAVGELSPRVIRNRRRAVKPMTLDEATIEMEARAEGILVFRDASSERMRILYRREDGHLGLIEPEA